MKILEKYCTMKISEQTGRENSPNDPFLGFLLYKAKLKRWKGSLNDDQQRRRIAEIFVHRFCYNNSVQQIHENFHGLDILGVTESLMESSSWNMMFL